MYDETARTIAVSKDDIDSGVRGSTKWCAIAAAINRAVPNANAVVSLEYIIRGKPEAYAFIKTAEGGKRVKLPDEAMQFICIYDYPHRWPGHVVQPFSFPLHLPTPAKAHAGAVGLSAPPGQREGEM